MLQQQKPFVLFKKPNDDTINLIAQNNQELLRLINFDVKGFLIAPFDGTKEAFYIRADEFFQESWQSIPVSFQKEKESNEFAEKHIALVQHAIQTIQNTDLSKIVVSREENFSYKDYKPLEIFKKMASVYTNAFVYVWYHPDMGYWSGATPELLVEFKDNKFHTMALAGTQTDQGEDVVQWGDKELEEQSMVTKYIAKQLQMIAENIEISAIETVKAGRLLHLKTSIKGRLAANYTIEQLVKVLHPTPAVCGLPMNESKQYILEYEGYDRKFYTGYLGLVNIEESTELFVNLRCFSYADNLLTLYIGGGITEKSIAEDEWNETVEKSKTIKSLLF